jgi:hypothetical protein
LGERVNGIHEVRGSIPLASTPLECGLGLRADVARKRALRVWWPDAKILRASRE